MSELDSSFKDNFKIFLLCLVWYFFSSATGIIGKTILTDFPYPVTLTTFQVFIIFICSGPTFRLWGISRSHDIPRRYFLKTIIPLALGKCFSTLLSQVSIWKVPVSYAHTIKATLPLFTVILSRLIFGEKPTMKVYLTLVPIILGVMIASFTEISFDGLGLLSALLATLGFSLQHIFSKKVLVDTSMHSLRLLYLLSKYSLLAFLPLWLYMDVPHMLRDPNLLANTDKFVLGVLLVADGLCSFAHNMVAFTVLSLVTPLTYSVCNATKRLVIIFFSILILRNPVTWLNCLGMTLAGFGVLLYQQAKYQANEEKRKQTILPMTTRVHNPLLRDFTPHYHYPAPLQNGHHTPR